jgi:hypothetical protein
MLSASCTTQGPAFPIGSIENPLILDDYSDSAITYEGTIRGEKLYIKVINIPYFNNVHLIELYADGDLDLYTYSDAFVTLQDSSTNSDTKLVVYESCEGTTTATGELYIMIDGTNTTSDTNFLLTAGT